MTSFFENALLRGLRLARLYEIVTWMMLISIYLSREYFRLDIEPKNQL